MSTEVQGASKPGWVRRVLIGANPIHTLMRVGVWIAIILLLRSFVVLPIRVQGVSMLPTYQEDGINFVNCLAYIRHPPQRGDVVAIRYAGRSIMLCKRIVGLPGEVIGFRQGRIEINGEPLDEPYVKRPCNWDHAPERLGANEYYVVGDNRSMEFEGHMQGIADRNRIVGKVLL